MIYISYNEQDITSVNYLNQMLRKQNFSTWIAYEQLLAGDSIDVEIEKSISGGNCFIFCIGKQGVSELQERELAKAKKYEKKIVPILLPNNETSVKHIILDTYTFIDFRKEFKDKNETTKLYKILNGDSDIIKTPLVENVALNNISTKQTTKKAVYVAILKDGKILIVQRAETQKTGGELWQLPGGKVNEQESSDQAALREIKEEVGLDLQQKKLIFIRDFVDKWIIDAKEDYFLMSLYIYFIERTPLDIHNEFKSHRWIPIQEVFDDKSIIYFSSTTKYLQYIRRYVLTHLPLNEIGQFIIDNFKSSKSLPKKLAGISEESTAVIYSFLSLLGFVSDRGDYYPASTLSHQLINLLAEWALTDGVIFEAIEANNEYKKIRKNDDPVAVAKFREGLFDHHSNLLGILSHKLPKALSTRRVASLLIFGKTTITNEKLVLVRWDFLANKYQIPSKGLEDIETDIKDIETAKSITILRFTNKMVEAFDYRYFIKTETQHIGAGSLSLLEGDGPMLRNYFISFFKLNPKSGQSPLINDIINKINKSTIDFLETVDDQLTIQQDTKRNLHFYMWVSIDRILKEPDKIVGEVFQGFFDLLDNISPEDLMKDIIEVDVDPQEYTPITFTPEKSDLDHKSNLRELYANRTS